jgi:hypothetical protein
MVSRSSEEGNRGGFKSTKGHNGNAHKGFRSNRQPTGVYIGVATDEQILPDLKIQHGLKAAGFNEQSEPTFNFTRSFNGTQNFIFARSFWASASDTTTCQLCASVLKRKEKQNVLINRGTRAHRLFGLDRVNYKVTFRVSKKRLEQLMAEGFL